MLSKPPFPGFRHEFFTLKNGLKLHYVVNAQDEAIASGNIAIFIHGKTRLTRSDLFHKTQTANRHQAFPTPSSSGEITLGHRHLRPTFSSLSIFQVMEAAMVYRDTMLTVFSDR